MNLAMVFRVALRALSRQKLRSVLAMLRIKRLELERPPLIVELADEANPDLLNPFLVERLDSLADEAQSELLRRAVETTDEKRDEEWTEREGLFAPPTDVEQIITRLRHAGVSDLLSAIVNRTRRRGEFIENLNDRCSLVLQADRI